RSESRTARLLREMRVSFVLALPLVLSQVSSMGMNIVDTVLAGRHGPVTLAAVGVGSADDCTANGRDAAYRAIHGGRDALGCDDGHAETSPVMAFAPAANGLRDTRGNVREWTSDCVGGACRERLVSGGSWASSVSDGTTRAFPADTGFNTIGFRVVREIP
ncbi:MAG TPA: SUMF1/EgtB/PvdO family nonheme iron enzyme, partial [Chiayiivirga sp.]|nr:SUMF1/EgtB/PvdO family nonheme iron enzyme [Chiayiivirga sp.]